MEGISLKQAATEQAVKGSPVAASWFVAWLADINLSDVVSFATLMYVALQCAYLIWTWKQKRELRRSRFERCYYCGDSFLYPVNLHHDEEECAAIRKRKGYIE